MTATVWASAASGGAHALQRMTSSVHSLSHTSGAGSFQDSKSYLYLRLSKTHFKVSFSAPKQWPWFGRVPRPAKAHALQQKNNKLTFLGGS